MEFFFKKLIITTALLSSIFLLLAIQSNVAYSSTFDKGLEQSSVETGHKKMTFFSADNLPGSIGSFFKIFYVVILGITYFILMVYAGIVWMTARGNDEKIEKSKNIIKNSTIGIIIAFMAFAIALFVLTIFDNLSIS